MRRLRIFTPRLERGRASNFAGDSATRRDQQGSTHIPSGRSASSTNAFPRKVDGFLTRFAILCARKGKLGELSMATRQVKTVTKTAPAARSIPAAKTVGKPKAAPAVVKLVTTKATNKERTAT